MSPSSVCWRWPVKPAYLNLKRSSRLIRHRQACVRQIEVVADLLMAARMACSDLPLTRGAPSGRFSWLSRCFARKGPGYERDIQDLISAASMACGELPREKGGDLVLPHRLTGTERRSDGHPARNLAATHEPDAMGDRDEAASQMTPDEIAKSQRMAREWRPRNRPL